MTEGLTVGKLVEILLKLPPDAEMYLSGDIMGGGHLEYLDPTEDVWVSVLSNWL